MRVKVEAVGLQSVGMRVFEMQKRFEDRSAFHRDVARPLLLSEFGRIFARQGDPAWTPLAPETVEEKTRAGYDLRILHRKGRLRKAYTAPGGTDSEVRITKEYLEFENRVPYAIYHEEGRGVPMRQVAGQVVANKKFRRTLSDRFGKWGIGERSR